MASHAYSTDELRRMAYGQWRLNPGGSRRTLVESIDTYRNHEPIQVRATHRHRAGVPYRG